MANNNIIIRFNDVSFDFGHNKTILDEASFSVRNDMKIALMGQNGAGKSTLFKLMTGGYKPTSGTISIDKKMTIATAHQVMREEDKKLNIEQYFKKYSGHEEYDLKRHISKILSVVNLDAKLNQIIKDFSGGQQARLLLAAALIQDPDLLLLDEPTNNLDSDGIGHLLTFLMFYPKSCLVISHDADFLNAFTEGVLYLDSFTHKIEQYNGDYYDVVEDIKARIEKENRLNARMAKEIKANKDKVNLFAHKGGKMRLVAKRMKEKIDKFESEKVNVRREDKTIRKFIIPAQQGLTKTILQIDSYTKMQNQKEVTRKTSIGVSKHQHLLISGPNGIGKSNLIESIAKGTAKGARIELGTRVGYYRQDFSTLNYTDTVKQSLLKAAEGNGQNITEEQLRSTAAGFLITSNLINTKIGSISEGQKGLVSFARLVLQRPGLLILDEPTNHINFRHLPIIAKALNDYEGAMVLVSHIPEFVEQIKIHKILELDK